MQLLNISCKGGSLRVVDGLLIHAGMTGKPVWQIPVQGVTVAEVSRKVMSVMEIRSPQGSRQIEWVSPGDIPKLQQALIQAQAQMPSYSPNPYAASAPTYPSYAQQPPYTYQQPGMLGQPPDQSYPPTRQSPQKRSARQWYRTQSKAARRGIGCGILIAILLLIGMCSSVVSAASHTNSQTSSDATPTNQVVQQAASSTATPAPAATITATPKPKPTAIPTPRPTNPPAQPTPTSAPAHTGVNGNPWGYDFNQGNYIYNPPADFCSYFACITTFWKGHGYVDQCVDGDYSKSGGLSGACSHHGGEAQPLYSH
jgi:hypothetical protein